MVYTVDEIIKTSKQGSYHTPKRRSDAKSFSLITDERTNLNEEDAKNVKALVRYVEEAYGVRLNLIGGGAGCTKFDFEIEGCPDSASVFIKMLMNDTQFVEKAKSAKFKILFTPDGYQRQIIEGEGMAVKKGGDINIHITDSNVNGLQVASKNSSQRAGDANWHKSSLEMALSELQKGVEALDENEFVNKGEYLEDVQTLRKEFNRSTPRHQIISTILGNLGSIASLVALADQVRPFIPAFS